MKHPVMIVHPGTKLLESPVVEFVTLGDFFFDNLRAGKDD